MRWKGPDGKFGTIVEDTEIDLLALPPQFAHLRPDKPTPHGEGWIEWLNQQRANAGKDPIVIRPDN